MNNIATIIILLVIFAPAIVVIAGLIQKVGFLRYILKLAIEGILFTLLWCGLTGAEIIIIARPAAYHVKMLVIFAALAYANYLIDKKK